MKRAIALILLLLAGGTVPSGATFTTNSANNQTLGAAADFGVHVSMTPPSPPLKGTVSLSATASETAGGTITNVEIQRSPAGAGTWSPACSTSVSPYTCSFNTTTVTSGLYDFRARATSSSGYTRTSAVVADRLVDNTPPSATMTDPGAWFGGSAVPLSSSSSDNSGGSGVTSVRYEYRTTPSGAWTTACTGSTAPNHSCNFNASALTTGTAYDFRAVAIDAATNEGASTPVTNRRADNAAPTTATLSAPTATYLSGSVVVAGTATDVNSGIAELRMQHKVLGASTWTDACSDNTSPYSCNWDTTLVADNWYEVRVLAVDAAGNTLGSATGAWRRVDNAKPTVSLTDPGSGLSGNVTLNATAADTGGSNLVSVSFQRSPAGAGTWTEVCEDTTSPWASCVWDTASGPDGAYDLRAVATDASGNSETSNVVASRTVDNPPSASDIQANTSATGTVGSGDTLTFTYTDAMNPASIIAGWNGTGSRAVTVNFANSGGNDVLTVRSGATVLPLTSASGVTMGANYVGGPGATFNATLTHSGATFTVTIGTTVSGSASSGGVAGSMTWNPSSAATTAAGTAVATTARTEQGSPADIDF